MLKRYWYGALVLLVVIGIGGLVFFRPKAPLEPVRIYKVTQPQESKIEEAKPSPSTAETTQPSCCENGDALCCKTPGSPCCPPFEVPPSTSGQSVQSTVGISTDVSDSDTTNNGSPLIHEGEGKVVPEHIVQEANRFREWKEKNDALADRRRAHRENFSYLRQQTNQHLVDFLMLRPIEKRRKAIEDMKQQLFALGASDADVAHMEQELYALGLDFVTEVPIKVAEVQRKEVIKAMNAHGAQIRDDIEVSEQITREQKELDAISKDF